MADIIQQRRDTAARWAQYNPILLEGEVGYVTDNPNQYKIGNGRDKWNDLPLRGYTGTITQDTGDDENAVMSQKAVTDKLSELGSKINSIETAVEENKDVIYEDIAYIKTSDLTPDQYYRNGGLSIGSIHPDTAIDFTNPTGTWGCLKLQVSKGSTITIKTYGGSNARAYALTDMDRKVLILAEGNLDTTLAPAIIHVEEDGYLYVNCRPLDNGNFGISIKKNKVQPVFDIVLNQKRYKNNILQIGYYYNLGNFNIGNIAPSQPNAFTTGSENTWGCVKLEVSKGSIITLKTKGGTNGRAYALTDSDRRIIQMAEAGFDSRTSPVTINIEKDGYLYINSTPARDDLFGVEINYPLDKQIKNLTNEVKELENSIKSESIPIPHMYNPVLNLTKPQLRVLDIGNSYTVDSTNYLPQLISSAEIDVSDMCLYTAVRGGASFKNWYDIYNDNDTYGYSISKKIGGLNADVSGSNTGGVGEKFRNTLTNNEWDLIIIHQVSTYAPYYDAWEKDDAGGYLSKFIRLIRKHQPKATIGFLLVHSYWSGFGSNTEGSSYERWKLIAESAKKLRANYGIDFIVPYGTAIQNIRASSLNTEHDLTNDGTHCAAGLGDYTAACAYFQALIAPRYGVSILGNPFRIDVEQTGTYPESEVSVTDENALIAQKAAFLASYNWYECINPEEVDI